MSTRWKQTYVEWGFVALLAALCAVLSVLQYRWTGEISRAEAEHLRAGLNEEARQFCGAFDAALTESCGALVPHDQMVDDQNRAAIHLQYFQKWQAAKPRPLFSRVAVAVSSGDDVQLFSQDLVTAKLSPMAWPSAWEPYRRNFSHARGGGFRPFENPSGLVIEFPVFGQQPSGRDLPPDNNRPPPDAGPLPDNEWMIFELNTNYVFGTWLPELVQTYLNPPGLPHNDVRVKTESAPFKILFSTPGAAPGNFEAPVLMRFNHQGRDLENSHGPGSDPRWELEVRPCPGALEAIVSSAHRRNLAVAIILNGLIFAAGFALVRHTRRSRTLAEAQMNFVANVSHELRTPLTVIRGAAHNLKRGVVQERSQIEQYAGLIMQHAEQLGEMVEQVLALAGAQKTNAPALRQSVDLADILPEAIATTAPDTQAAHCEVHLELPSGLPIILGDPAALRRVFQNLISNAARHGGSEKWIGVTATNDELAHPPMIEVRVADRGAGIPAAEQADIFKPFFRGAQAQSRQIRGSGLGLSLVREIVESHGGTISVHSVEGSGATFTVRLPVAERGSLNRST